MPNLILDLLSKLSLRFSLKNGVDRLKTERHITDSRIAVLCSKCFNAQLVQISSLNQHRLNNLRRL